MPAVQPTHRLAQLSDLHFTANNAPLQAVIDTEAQLRQTIERLAGTGLSFDAVILSGDLADEGSPDAYQRLAGWIAAISERLDCPVLAGLGNHDARAPYHATFGGGESLAPLDTVTDINGLRIIHLDSSMPDAAHGEVTAAQLEWLGAVLAEPAAHGSILVIHHPPIPTSSQVMALVELINPDALIPVLTGSDVRMILSGHMHHSGTAALAGIPIAIANGVGYAADPLFDHLGYRGMTAGQSFNLIEVFDHQVVTKVVSVAEHPTLHQITPEQLAALLAASSEGD